MLKSSMAATFESKMAAISGLFLHTILASGAVRNLTVVFKHMFRACIRNNFLRLSTRSGIRDMLESNMAAILESKMVAIPGFLSTYLGFCGG